MFDRESGKPKGYGFCEYKDQETALSAMRNLNGYEIGGRTLRVDNACTEKSRMEMQQLLQGPQVENPFGEPCPPEQAPEVITKTVASLPPEQMFELMRQMKLCIQNNPAEARQMLLMNPQLSYALLQAMVVMKIIDPQTGLTMLFKANQVPPVFGQNQVTGQPQIMQMPKNQPPERSGPPPFQQAHQPSHDIDLRNVDPRMNNGGNGPPMIDPRNMPRNIDQDMRAMGPMIPNPVPPPNMDPRGQRSMPPGPFPVDPRQRGNNDPRLRPGNPPPMNNPNIPPGMGPMGQEEDQEKAALIMQVLQLSDEQIALLPPEQRASILVLKEQIAKSSHR